jgi:uncharacterized membrane protein YheB (UPF0754 family)
MNPLLSGIIPPALGALIGYVTNAVAIRMLFRPLREIRVLGFRLPFTPGVLPRERRKLAENIGRMVERELFTPEVLATRLDRPEVREGIRDSVARYTGKLLAASPAELFRGSAPAPGGADAGALEKNLVPRRGDFFTSPGWERILESLGEALAAYAQDRGLLEKSLREILGDPGAGRFGDQLRGKLDGLTGEALDSPAFAEHLSHGLAALYDPVRRRLMDFFRQEEVHRELEAQGLSFLSRVKRRMSGVQRIFAEPYARSLEDRMPGIIDDLLSQGEELLETEHIRRRVLELLGGAILRLLGEEETRRRICRFAEDRIEALADRPLGDFFAPGDLETLPGRLARGLPALVSAAPPAPLLRLFLDRLGKKETTLGALLALEGEKKDALDTLITGKLISLATGQIGAILGSINVKEMVAARIDSLDMIRVERIVLDVMANQLKWINLFGAILGALIGLSQLLLGGIADN